MTLPLRMAAPIAAGMGIFFAVPPASAFSAEAETQLASNDRGSRTVARKDALPVRIKPATPPAAPAAPFAREAFVEPVWAQVSADMVNARTGPGTQFAIVSTLRGGDYIRAVARAGGWIEMQWPEGAPAWVSQDFVKPDGTVTGSNVRLRSGGSLNASILSEAGKGDKLEIVGSAGGWYKVKAPANAKAYIFARYVILGVRPPAGPASPAANVIPPQPEAETRAPAAPNIEPETEPNLSVVTQEDTLSPAAEKKAALDAAETASAPVLQPALEMPKMEIAARAEISLLDVPEATIPTPNSPSVLELLAQEVQQVPIVPPIVMEIIPQEAIPADSPAEIVQEPKTPMKAPVPAPETDRHPASTPPHEFPMPQPEPRTVLPAAQHPVEENLWGDELPPPKRVKILPGPRGDPAQESSQAPSPAPAEREGGLVKGLVSALMAPPAGDADDLKAEVVDMSLLAPASAPKQIARPGIARTPILPMPSSAAPYAIRLPASHRGTCRPVASNRTLDAEGRIEVCPTSIPGASGCSLQANDGSRWTLIDDCDCFSASYIGVRVRIVGSAGTDTCSDSTQVLFVKQIAMIPE